MNQKNGQNSLGLDNCFGDEANPIVLFKNWFSVAEKSEINENAKIIKKGKTRKSRKKRKK